MERQDLIAIRGREEQNTKTHIARKILSREIQNTKVIQKLLRKKHGNSFSAKV